MLTSVDQQRLANLAGSNSETYRGHALVPSGSETTVEAQHAAALAYWTFLQTDSDLSAAQKRDVAAVIELLSQSLAQLRNPLDWPNQPIPRPTPADVLAAQTERFRRLQEEQETARKRKLLDDAAEAERLRKLQGQSA